MTKAEHVKVDTDSAPNAAGFCAHCGAREVVEVPLPMTEFIERLDVFISKHADCPEPEVLHPRPKVICDWCAKEIERDEQGHLTGVGIGPDPSSDVDRHAHLECLAKLGAEAT